ncbi:Serine/threonine-protein kinase PrkC [Botrimarina colliarenosi]|uniref:Serine/threonine-protein kinase PrkC n=2 Tax=Botrimarina colliarenosi TaxID=2528001 RepID=A0A5C6AKB7_9BACT|nr:Serine/threonine-protein kinase PrkC [Botrimarina colliarenosi]
MHREAPAANDQADGPSGQDGSTDGSRGRRAAKFQYATGDQPLDGYTIKRGVGRGGFGEVYFATSDAGKEVALKLIRRNLDIELRGVRQCLNLKHPNLVALYDLRSDSADDQWVVMEYVAGESLEDAINRSPDGMPIEEAIAWLRGIAAGVGYLHASGIVHRDLKPANIYLERAAGPIEQRVKIGDYGLSKFISTSRRSGQTESVGTVHYMAPEIAGGRYGREIDTYALGIVLYEMLTGSVPFEGESVGEVLMKHLTAEPELSRVGEPYRTIVARTLAKDPELRLSSVEEMLAMLPSATETNAASAQPGAAQGPPHNKRSGGISDELVYGPIRHWVPVSSPPHTNFPTPQREPLWQALVDESHRIRSWWGALAVPPLGKALILFGAVTLLVFSGAAIALPAAVLPFYLVYYVIWSAFLKESGAPQAAASLHETTHFDRPVKPSAPRRTRYNWRLAAMQLRSARSLRQKATSLTGSMLGSALVATIAAAIAAPLLAKGTPADPVGLGAWLAVMGTLGSWGVLIASGVAETHVEDHLPRRGMNLLAGMALGAVGFGLASFLGVQLPYAGDWGFSPREVALNGFFNIDLYSGVAVEGHAVAVPAVASLAFFGGLFALVRWWRSTDYIRRSRVSLWSIALTSLGAWLVTLVTWFPQPTGLVLAGMIALAVQVSSPWCPPSRRAALARGEGGGIYDA